MSLLNPLMWAVGCGNFFISLLLSRFFLKLMEEVVLKPKRGRKLVIPGQSRAERKRKANCNEEYISSRGEVKKPKKIQAVDGCCSKKCFSIISEDDQRLLFDKFHQLGSYESRAIFLSSNMHKEWTKYTSFTRGRKEKAIKRFFTFNMHRVCKHFFVNMLQINASRYELVASKLESCVFKDLRGVYPHPKLSIEKEQFAIDVIMSIPRYTSHYCRETTSACYLGPEWDKAKLHRLYVDLWKKHHPEIPMTLMSFTKIFDRYNLKFKGRNKDCCKTCDFLHARSKTGEDVEEVLKSHHEKAESLRNSMREDLKAAESDATLEVLTFDFQKVHPLPSFETSIMYYLRKLANLNFGIHSGKSNKAFFYNWIETEAGRGADEVGSCLRNYIMNYVKNPVTSIVLYSDCCGGQNRNFKLCLILQKVLHDHPSLQSITLRFLQSGHSYLPNDRDFGHYEKLIRKQEKIELPSQYVQLMKECHVNAHPVEVIEMTHDKFISSSSLHCNVVRRKKCVITKQNVEFLKTHQIRMTKNEPSKLYFKYFPLDNAQVIVMINFFSSLLILFSSSLNFNIFK